MIRIPFLPERGFGNLTIKDAATPGNNRRPFIDPFPVRFGGFFWHSERMKMNRLLKMAFPAPVHSAAGRVGRP
jgi:hypothetical protein